MKTVYFFIAIALVLLLLIINFDIDTSGLGSAISTRTRPLYDDEKVMLADAEYCKSSEQCELFKKRNKWHPVKFKIVSLPWNVCATNQGADLKLFVYVYIRLQSFEARRNIRQTWANRELFPQLNVAFVLGSSANSSLNKRVTEENKIHGDILHGDFVDAYQNLTFKAQMTFRWVKHNCMNAPLVAKMDGKYSVYINFLN